MSSFDQAAEKYDSTFTNTGIGKAQREQVWGQIDPFLSEINDVLEINCGTGTDAHWWKEQGKMIRATDISVGMIEAARKKYPGIDFEELDIKDIDKFAGTYDAVFSNFGGLNCLSPEEINDFFQKVTKKLSKGGKLLLVIMGKKCWWDKFYLAMNGRWKQRSRRNTKKSLDVVVDGATVSTWYYSPFELKKLASPYFEKAHLAPIGLFVPPSYLAGYFEKKGGLLKGLKFLDKYLSFGFLSNRSDHYFIVLTKKTK